VLYGDVITTLRGRSEGYWSAVSRHDKRLQLEIVL
jgi:hypothetical protein